MCACPYPLCLPSSKDGAWHKRALRQADGWKDSSPSLRPSRSQVKFLPSLKINPRSTCWGLLSGPHSGPTLSSPTGLSQTVPSARLACSPLRLSQTLAPPSSPGPAHCRNFFETPHLPGAEPRNAFHHKSLSSTPTRSYSPWGKLLVCT